MAVVLLVGCSRPVTPLPDAPWPSPTPVPPPVLPRDAGPHDALTEWWYYTGHLRTDAGAREYGFEFTVFQAQRQGEPTGYLAHFAVTNVDDATFSHQTRSTAGDFQSGSDVVVQDWRLTREGPADVIEAAMQRGPGAELPYGLRLRLVATKAPALHHGGYIDYGPAGGSYYYSRTRLDVSGELREGEGEPQAVTGQAWMDHQWGNFIVAPGGWDWFSIQLDDQTELMLYTLRDDQSGQRSPVTGSQVEVDGAVEDVAAGAARIEALDQWTSPHTGATYPSGWTVELPERGLRLRLTPRVKDQELYFPDADRVGGRYWEGAVTVEGERAGAPVSGLGYVELTGYAP